MLQLHPNIMLRAHRKEPRAAQGRSGKASWRQRCQGPALLGGGSLWAWTAVPSAVLTVPGLLPVTPQEQLPDLNTHFRSQSFHTSMYASSWFLTLFLTTFPLPVATRVFDIFMYEVRTPRAPSSSRGPTLETKPHQAGEGLGTWGGIGELPGRGGPESHCHCCLCRASRLCSGWALPCCR